MDDERLRAGRLQLERDLAFAVAELMVVTVAPALSMPKKAISNSAQFGARMPTMEPLPRPIVAGADASLPEYASSSANVNRRSPSTMAVSSGHRSADCASRRCTGSGLYGAREERLMEFG